ncbi:MAG: DUF2835 domain-containing protein [Chromatiales bacterium]|jgi:hypothetical protein|nr:DUF2835 domain-containing protein [Chromatiales bacterium]
MSVGVQEIVIDLAIAADDYLRYYQGSVSAVRVKARDGRMVQFPAQLLRRFVSREGVHGTFVLRCRVDHRLLGMERIAESSS